MFYHISTEQRINKKKRGEVAVSNMFYKKVGAYTSQHHNSFYVSRLRKMKLKLQKGKKIHENEMYTWGQENHNTFCFFLIKIPWSYLQYVHVLLHQ